MQQRNVFTWRARFKSFVFAAQGIRTLLITEHNARIHLGFTVLAVGSGLFFRINYMEWIALVFSIASVWTMELINTAIEKSMDLITTEIHPVIRKVKDLAAAAVLLSAVAALLTGCFIFLPKIFFYVSQY